MEGDLDTPLFGDSGEEVTSHPKVVTHRDTFARPNLELPLSGHDLSVDTADDDTGVQAGAVVSFDQITSEDLASSRSTIIGALRTRETALGPTDWVTIGIEKCILLLEAKPGRLILCLVHYLLCMMAIICPVRGTIVVVGFRQDENVVATTEGILENGSWAEVDIGVMPRCLVCRGTVEIPYSQLTDISNLLGHGRGFRAKAPIAVNPDVFSLNFLTLRKSEVWGEEVVVVYLGSHIESDAIRGRLIDGWMK